MRLPIVKIAISMLLLAAGTGLLVYGTGSRRVPVWAVVMVEKEEMILERVPAPMWDGPAGPGGRRPNLPPPPPRPKRVKVEVAEEQEQRCSEPKVIRDVTIGGIARLEDGRLQFTYGPGEDGPALCPT
jgi:hypothetical protein